MAISKELVVAGCVVPWGHVYNYFDYCTECGEDRPW